MILRHYLCDRLCLEQVQGDMAYLTGEMGNPTIIPQLEKTAKKAGNSELSIVAYEAIQRIKERN